MRRSPALAQARKPGSSSVNAFSTTSASGSRSSRRASSSTWGKRELRLARFRKWNEQLKGARQHEQLWLDTDEASDLGRVIDKTTLVPD
jgi:hypothetical protein